MPSSLSKKGFIAFFSSNAKSAVYAESPSLSFPEYHFRQRLEPSPRTGMQISSVVPQCQSSEQIGSCTSFFPYSHYFSSIKQDSAVSLGSFPSCDAVQICQLSTPWVRIFLVLIPFTDDCFLNQVWLSLAVILLETLKISLGWESVFEGAFHLVAVFRLLIPKMELCALRDRSKF